MRKRPDTVLEALMQAPPGVEPEQSLEDVAALRDAVAASIALVSDEDRFILEAIFYEGVSQRALAPRLGLQKTRTGVLVAQAKEHLGRVLLTNPIIRERLGVEQTWNDACREALLGMSPANDWADTTAMEIILATAVKLREQVNTEPLHGRLTQLLERIGHAAAVMLVNAGRWDIHRLEELLCSKQADYGPGNILAFNFIGIAVRMSDKIARWEHIVGRGLQAQNESLEDTLDDMVGYAVVATMLYDGTFTLPLEGEKDPLEVGLV